MNSYYDNESRCSQSFCNLGKCHHLWTPENFETIFFTENDFKIGMNIIGICAKLSPDIKIITFEIMSNHLHFAIKGDEESIMTFFESVKKFLSRHFAKAGRAINWANFLAKSRELSTLDDIRNVIVYINRNGYVVTRHHTPFSYPWGTNRYYFNSDAVALSSLMSRQMTQRERQSSINSRVADHIEGLSIFEGCALPLSFCYIDEGESLFRDASHYFYKLGRSIETNKAIAREISESIFYTDDELYLAISSLAKEKYGIPVLAQASANIKMELARIMKFDYNATPKQIARFLKISIETLNSIFGK